MNARTCVTLLLVVGLAAADGGAQDKQPTPAQQFKKLLAEYQRVSSSGKISTDEERMQFIGQVYKHRTRLAQKFVELAEKNPKDPIAVEALMQAIWQVNGTPWPAEIVGQDDVQPGAIALLLRDHVQSDKLGPACQRLSYGYCKEYETFLRTVLKCSSHKEVQALALLSLAHYLQNRVQRLELIKAEPKLAKEFAGLFGKDYLTALQRQDRARVQGEIETLFEQAVKDFGDVKIPYGGTIGKKASAELFEMRHLSVGKVAPDIEGDDQDGKRFKLSDYRGKVVLLDFWHQQ